MTKKNLYKDYIRYLLPTIATMVLFSTYTMIDGIFIGRGVGLHALAAVNISMPFIASLFAIAMLISIGSSNIITHYLGLNNRKKADEFFTLTISISFAISIIISLLAYLNVDILADLLGSTEDIKHLVIDYLSIIILFSTFFIMTYIFEIMVKADGNPHLAIIYMIISALTNIVLDYVFIFVFDYGVKGAAIATGIAQTLPCIGYMIHFNSSKSILNLKKFNIKIKDLLNILKFGVPTALTELSTGFIILLFNNTLSDTYGDSGIATFSVIAYLLSLIVNTMLAINQSAQPLISYNNASGNKENVQKLKKYMMSTILLMSILIFIFIQIFAKNIFDVFISDYDEEFINFSIRALRIFSFAFLIIGYNTGIGGYLTAIKVENSELIISLLRGYIAIGLSIYIIPMIFGRESIWYILIASEFITLIFSLILFNKKKGLKA